MWIFGYGSLIWRPGFEYVDRKPGHVRGWKRRFWQGSTDHRGTPDAPGRVVTLLPDEASICWGVAYRIEGSVRDRVLDQLDHREKGGYERHIVDIYEQAPQPIIEGALVYVATPENPNWLGPASADTIARQIALSHGPSGPNVEYLLELERALRHDLQVQDDHIFELAEHLRRLEDDL